MDLKKMTKQMIDFQKAAFDNTFGAMTLLQEQAERMATIFQGQTQEIPEEGKKAINEWVKAYKKGREDFRKSVDDSFKKVEDYFADAEKTKSK